MKSGFLRLEPKTPTDACVLWDTPSPPARDLCRYFGEEKEGPQRMRSISLDQYTTGITAFCTGGRIYGIYAHRGGSSAVDTCSRLTQRLQEQVVWLYFPLKPGELVHNILIRYRHQSPSIKSSNPIIVVIYTDQISMPSLTRHRYTRLMADSIPLGNTLNHQI